MTGFAAEFLKGGGQILARRTLLVGKQDFSRLLAQIEKTAPGFLYAPVFLSEAAVLSEEVVKMEGLKNTVIGGADVIWTPDWLEAAGRAAEGVYLSAPDCRFRDPRFDREFVPQFERRFGGSIEVWPGFLAQAYDATSVVLDAIEDVVRNERLSGALGNAPVRLER